MMLPFLLMMMLADGPASDAAPSLDCRLANQNVEAAIARKVASLQGVEYCQFRHYDALDDLDGDGKNDLIVLFNVEPASGGNGHSDFMAVFLSSDPPGAEPLIVRTGGRGERDPIAIAVRGRRITLETQEYLPKDSLCCPSGHGTVVFELAGHTLKRVASAKKGAASRNQKPNQNHRATELTEKGTYSNTSSLCSLCLCGDRFSPRSSHQSLRIARRIQSYWYRAHRESQRKAV